MKEGKWKNLKTKVLDRFDFDSALKVFKTFGFGYYHTPADKVTVKTLRDAADAVLSSCIEGLKDPEYDYYHGPDFPVESGRFLARGSWWVEHVNGVNIKRKYLDLKFVPFSSSSETEKVL